MLPPRAIAQPRQALRNLVILMRMIPVVLACPLIGVPVDAVSTLRVVDAVLQNATRRSSMHRSTRRHDNTHHAHDKTNTDEGTHFHINYPPSNLVVTFTLTRYSIRCQEAFMTYPRNLTPFSLTSPNFYTRHHPNPLASHLTLLHIHAYPRVTHHSLR